MIPPLVYPPQVGQQGSQGPGSRGGGGGGADGGSGSIFGGLFGIGVNHLQNGSIWGSSNAIFGAGINPVRGWNPAQAGRDPNINRQGLSAGPVEGQG